MKITKRHRDIQQDNIICHNQKDFMSKTHISKSKMHFLFLFSFLFLGLFQCNADVLGTGFQSEAGLSINPDETMTIQGQAGGGDNPVPPTTSLPVAYLTASVVTPNVIPCRPNVDKTIPVILQPGAVECDENCEIAISTKDLSLVESDKFNICDDESVTICDQSAIEKGFCSVALSDMSVTSLSIVAIDKNCDVISEVATQEIQENLLYTGAPAKDLAVDSETREITVLTENGIVQSRFEESVLRMSSVESQSVENGKKLAVTDKKIAVLSHDQRTVHQFELDQAGEINSISTQNEEGVSYLVNSNKDHIFILKSFDQPVDYFYWTPSVGTNIYSYSGYSYSKEFRIVGSGDIDVETGNPIQYKKALAFDVSDDSKTLALLFSDQFGHLRLQISIAHQSNFGGEFIVSTNQENFDFKQIELYQNNTRALILDKIGRVWISEIDQEQRTLTHQFEIENHGVEIGSGATAMTMDDNYAYILAPSKQEITVLSLRNDSQWAYKKPRKVKTLSLPTFFQNTNFNCQANQIKLLDENTLGLACENQVTATVEIGEIKSDAQKINSKGSFNFKYDRLK